MKTKQLHLQKVRNKETEYIVEWECKTSDKNNKHAYYHFLITLIIDDIRSAEEIFKSVENKVEESQIIRDEPIQLMVTEPPTEESTTKSPEEGQYLFKFQNTSHRIKLTLLHIQ